MANSSRIDAAGGLLWREVDGRLQVALVHRERYDDWSLPKGKIHRGEPTLTAALREVNEETGAHVEASRRLGLVRYPVDGVDKSVRFWAMRYLAGEFAPSAEVGHLEWLDPDAARTRMTYAGEQRMLETLTARPLPTSVVVIVRHAKAGKRSEWAGADALRPLESKGRRQARALADLVSAFAPGRIVSANPLRCVQTVQPLAERIGLPIEIDTALSDEVSAVDPGRARALFDEFVRAGRSVAVCSQGDTIGVLLGETSDKGGAWVLSCRDGSVVDRDYYGAETKIPVRNGP